MATSLKSSLVTVYGSVAEDLMKRLGDSQAAQMGPPTSTEDKVEPATDADRVNAWNAMNPAATDQAMLELARQKYAEHLQSGMDPQKAERATAEDLTHFRYDQRLKLYTYGWVGFKEQVAAAERLAKLAKRETTPDPPAPPPTMTSLQPMFAPRSGTAGRPGQPPERAPRLPQTGPAGYPDATAELPHMGEVSPDGY